MALKRIPIRKMPGVDRLQADAAALDSMERAISIIKLGRKAEKLDVDFDVTDAIASRMSADELTRGLLARAAELKLADSWIKPMASRAPRAPARAVENVKAEVVKPPVQRTFTSWAQ